MDGIWSTMEMDGLTLKQAGKNIYRFEEFFSMSQLTRTMMQASNLLSLHHMESLKGTHFIKAYLLMVGADPQVTRFYSFNAKILTIINRP